jgi:hypothetical protein
MGDYAEVNAFKEILSLAPGRLGAGRTGLAPVAKP